MDPNTSEYLSEDDISKHVEEKSTAQGFPMKLLLASINNTERYGLPTHPHWLEVLCVRSKLNTLPEEVQTRIPLWQIIPMGVMTPEAKAQWWESLPASIQNRMEEHIPTVDDNLVGMLISAVPDLSKILPTKVINKWVSRAPEIMLKEIVRINLQSVLNYNLDGERTPLSRDSLLAGVPPQAQGEYYPLIREIAETRFQEAYDSADDEWLEQQHTKLHTILQELATEFIRRKSNTKGARKPRIH